MYSEHTIRLQARYRQFRNSLADSLILVLFLISNRLECRYRTSMPTIVHSCLTNCSVYHEISSEVMGLWMSHCCGLINGENTINSGDSPPLYKHPLPCVVMESLYRGSLLTNGGGNMIYCFMLWLLPSNHLIGDNEFKYIHVKSTAGTQRGKRGRKKQD